MQADKVVPISAGCSNFVDFPISRFRDLEITGIAKSRKLLVARIDVDDVENALRLIDQDHTPSKDHALPISG